MAGPELIPGETVLLLVQRHPIALVRDTWKGGLGLVALGLLLALVPIKALDDLRLFLVLATALILVIYVDLRYIAWRAQTFAITDQRVILSSGVVRRFSKSLALNKVQDITTRQGVVGRMFGYGTIEVESAGRDSVEILDLMPEPDHFRNILFQQTQRFGQLAPSR